MNEQEFTRELYKNIEEAADVIAKACIAANIDISVALMAMDLMLSRADEQYKRESGGKDGG